MDADDDEPFVLAKSVSVPENIERSTMSFWKIEKLRKLKKIVDILKILEGNVFTILQEHLFMRKACSKRMLRFCSFDNALMAQSAVEWK